jgi:hypothetical protein
LKGRRFNRHFHRRNRGSAETAEGHREAFFLGFFCGFCASAVSALNCSLHRKSFFKALDRLRGNDDQCRRLGRQPKVPKLEEMVAEVRTAA